MSRARTALSAGRAAEARALRIMASSTCWREQDGRMDGEGESGGVEENEMSAEMRASPCQCQQRHPSSTWLSPARVARTVPARPSLGRRPSYTVALTVGHGGRAQQHSVHIYSRSLRFACAADTQMSPFLRREPGMGTFLGDGSTSHDALPAARTRRCSCDDGQKACPPVPGSSSRHGSSTRLQRPLTPHDARRQDHGVQSGEARRRPRGEAAYPGKA